MRALPMRELLSRVAGEWAAKRSAFDIPEESVRRALALEASSPGFQFNGLRVALPVGPAAGPHTQIAPNLVAGWLAGSRVFELKTVQVNDSLDIDKPCIDALDEGHNVEWSTELSLEEARAEYLRGWIAIHLLRAALSSPEAEPGPVAFNMSVGYTLDGIKSERMDAFIEGMRSPGGTATWREAMDDARAAVDGQRFSVAFGPEGAKRARDALDAMPDQPVHSVTLSTMHGCPPDEIERIGAYLIRDKGFDTFIKLNPTLLGYDEARSILDRTGWERVRITRPNFEHDLQFDAALALIASLEKAAADSGVRFGIKLSNTLANVNDGTRLPGGERYMSGRALFPLTTRLAARLARSLSRPPLFSYCGGVSAGNVGASLDAGLGPLTVATDILKPGGYLRLEPMAREAVAALKRGVPKAPDPDKLDALAASALSMPEYRGDYKKGHARIARTLPLSDCFAAPCVEACPANQKAPAYIKTLGKGDAKGALAIILEDNPLPRVTGVLCDHQCMPVCSRVDYEGPVNIRAMKLASARRAELAARPAPRVSGKGKAAVFGAGPAGLACAHFLALDGYPVTVFDTAPGPGGVPANVIPAFRIDPSDIAADVDRIQALGAEFRFGWDGGIDLDALKQDGYTSFVVATGAPVPRALDLKGAGIPVVDALEFLEAAHVSARGGKPGPWDGVRAVAVVGGGNTAMDAARVAARLPGSPSVSILYRRTLAEMPADREEFEAALADGVKYRELSLPETAEAAAGGDLPTLTVREMELGAPDSSGRRAPVQSDRTTRMPCELLVAAVGESPDSRLLSSLGVAVEASGRPVVDQRTMLSGAQGVFVVGDARRGPASIIAAEADGKKAAHAILRIAGIEPSGMDLRPGPIDREALSRRGEIIAPAASDGELDDEGVSREASRCLSCGSACLRCVEVCPNRANLALPVDVHAGGPFTQALQILHIDELCNECGNCGFFCPYDGEPFTGKPTLFRDETTLRASGNAGFAFLGAGPEPELALRSEPGRRDDVVVLPYSAWSRTADAENAGLIAMARTVLAEHDYLLPGGRP